MNNLLILNNRRDDYSNLIWRIAIQNGWKTFRMVVSDDLADVSKGYDVARFYGDTLTAGNMRNPPFIFHEIDVEFCAKVYQAYPQYCGRYIIAEKYGNLQYYDFDIFVKPVRNKWFEAKVYKSTDTIGNEHCKSDDPIYIQGIIEPNNEIRCFVLNGEVLTASYYRKNKEFQCEHIPEIPDQVQKMVKDICKLTRADYGIVLDFTQVKDSNEWIFLEVNEAWASGLYDCDPQECFKCIIESQYQKKYI